LQYGKPIIVITGTLTANLNLIFPAIVNEWTVINNTTGPYTITCKTAAGTGLVVNTAALIVGDGTNIQSAVTDAAALFGETVATATGGTSDAITATFSPVPRYASNGVPLSVRATAANATTTPTFTPNSGVIAAATIVKGNNIPLAVGDIAGAGHWLELAWDSTLSKWVLLNPANGVNATTAKQIQPVGASVAANAMTVTLNPTNLDFRSATANSGTVNTRTIGTQLSLTIPSTATLGTTSAIASRILLLAIDNAGTVELAVYNAAGGANLDETGVINTTAIAAGSNSLTVYSQTARTGVPYRVVGYVDSTQATAGTWATAPSAVQGIGGQALAAMSSIGYGQTWQSVIGSRALATTYYNTTGRPLMVSAAVVGVGSGTTTAAATVNGVVVATQAGSYPSTGTATISNVVFVVPPGGSYSIESLGSASLSLHSWNELR